MTAADTPDSEIEFKYDALGQVIWESQNGQVTEHEYDAVGRRIKRRSPSGQIVEYTYNTDSQLSRLQTPRGSMEFEYDKAGRIAKRRMPGELEESFYYDRCGRVIEQSLYKPSHTLSHRGYKYDLEGNLVEKRRAGSLIRYSYDPDNQLIAVESEEGGRIEFMYDAFRRRIAKETKDGKVGFLWDGDVLLVEERSEKSNEYIFEPGNFAPLCRFDGEGFEAYHNDHLGTPHELTDERGEIVWSARFDVYGRANQLRADRTENQIRVQCGR